jgi:hypothetical protein
MHLNSTQLNSTQLIKSILFIITSLIFTNKQPKLFVSIEEHCILKIRFKKGSNSKFLCLKKNKLETLFNQQKMK